MSGDTPLGHVTSNFDGGHITRNDPKMVISGHMIFIKMADNMAKWGLPRKSTQNAAQGNKLEHKIFIQSREIDKKLFLKIFTF